MMRTLNADYIGTDRARTAFETKKPGTLNPELVHR